MLASSGKGRRTALLFVDPTPTIIALFTSFPPPTDADSFFCFVLEGGGASTPCLRSARVSVQGMVRVLAAMVFSFSFEGMGTMPSHCQQHFLGGCVLCFFWHATNKFGKRNTSQYIAVHSSTVQYILLVQCSTAQYSVLQYSVSIVQTCCRRKLLLGSSISFSILRKKKKMRNLSHFLVMLERFWEHSHPRRNSSLWVEQMPSSSNFFLFSKDERAFLIIADLSHVKIVSTQELNINVETYSSKKTYKVRCSLNPLFFGGASISPPPPLPPNPVFPSTMQRRFPYGAPCSQGRHVPHILPFWGR